MPGGRLWEKRVNVQVGAEGEGQELWHRDIQAEEGNMGSSTELPTHETLTTRVRKGGRRV